MSQSRIIEFKDLPIASLSEDENQPRLKLNVSGDKDRLMLSIQELGIQQPIAVVKIGTDRYQIIDGHRRFLCAKELNMEKVPCRIYRELKPGELERVRFELQNNRRLWKPIERSSALSSFKKSAGISSNKEAAQKLFISETLISNSLKLDALKTEYKELMDKYELGPSYRVEFVKLQPKLRQIEEFTVNDIINNLFKRVFHQVIHTSKDFRTIGRIFLRATANHDQIYTFLKDEDMLVKELEESTIQSGFSLWLEQSIEKIKANQKAGTKFSEKESKLLYELQKALEKSLHQHLRKEIEKHPLNFVDKNRSK